MAVLFIWLVTMVLLVGGVIFVIYLEPIPAGFRHPWRVKRLLAMKRYVFALVELFELLGLVSKVTFMRAMAKRNLHSRLTPGVMVSDIMLCGVPVRVYERPDTRHGARRPALVYLPGGGWVFGSPGMAGPVASYLVKHSPYVVISVGYRLAPEHPALAAHTDCLAVTRALLQQPTTLNLCASRITICGESCGGNLAATVALALRDEMLTTPLAAQILINPITQLVDLKTASYIQFQHGPLVTRTENADFISAYVTGGRSLSQELLSGRLVPASGQQKLRQYGLFCGAAPCLARPRPAPPSALWGAVGAVLTSPYVSPLLADDLAGLPKTYIYTCEHDLVRDDGKLYERRLKQAGNDVTSFNDHVAIHGKFGFVNDVIPEATVNLDKLIAFMDSV